jgi:murein DD-endopeptidase MepM/ murein hydrolase activator NlpD
MPRLLTAFVVGCCAALTAVPAAATPPASLSKVERVLTVVEFFGSPVAAATARNLAGLQDPTGVQVDLTNSAWSAQELADAAATAIARIGYDYFEPATPGAAPTPLEDLVPASRRYLVDVATSSGVACPVRGSSFGDTWGAPRSGGRVHVGTDMIAPIGTPVFAVGDGTVLRVDLVDEFVPGVERDLGGITMTYQTVWGDVFYIGHLATLSAGMQPGTRITAGAQIAQVGQTGNARLSVPHLHIQWHPLGGAPVNPYPLLEKAC